MHKTFYLMLVIVIFVSFCNCTLFYEDDEDDVFLWNRCSLARNALKNGRVKLRNRGRIAKFMCDPGYEIVGKRFSTCVRGSWNYRMPTCVARGCHTLPDVRNARVSEGYRGAVLTYDCLPGYTLRGISTLYCDGRRWTADVPSCGAAATSASTSCDFEDPDLCGWSQDTNTHDSDWKRNQFSTPSGHSGTGPSYDHTFGIGKGGFYLYQEASAPRKPNDVSRLFSPVFSVDKSGGCFLLWYHMYGSTIGGLKVFIKPESHVFGELLPVWELYGDQGNEWYRANVSIPRYSENFQIVIEGVRGANYIGDTAIDDVYLTNVSCEVVGNAHENISFTATNSCRGRCREANISSYCGCNDDCHSNGNCCFDFTKICTGNYDSESENPSEEQESKSLTTTTKNIPTENTNSTEVTNSVFSSTGTISFNSSERQLYTTYSALDKTTILVTLPPVIPETVSTALLSTTTQSTIPTSDQRQTEITSLTTADLASTTMVITPSSTTTTTPSSTTPYSTTTLSTSSSSTPTSKTVTLTNIPVPTTESAKTVQTTISTTVPIIVSSSQNTDAISESSSYATAGEKTDGIFFSSRQSVTSLQDSVNTTTSSSFSPNVSYSPHFYASTNRFSVPSLPPETTKEELTTASTSTSTFIPTTSTRKTYNLRPRNRTLIPFTSTSTTRPTRMFYLPTTSRMPSTTKTTPYPVVRTSWFYFRTTRSTTTIKSSTSTSTERLTTPQTTLTTTELSSGVTDNYTLKSASTAANSSQHTIVIISAIIGILMCIAGGSYYIMKKRTQKRQSKLSDDSEMRFLSENEIVDYSDPTALDKILIH